MERLEKNKPKQNQLIEGHEDLEQEQLDRDL